MNVKHFFIKHNYEKGMALPFTLGIGVIVMLASSTIMVRSQIHQTHAAIQQSTSQGINVADVAVTRIFALINKNPYLATYPDCINRDSNGQCTDSGSDRSWANVSNISKELTLCKTEQTTDIENLSYNQAWQPIDPNKPTQGEYRLISYQYSDAPGVTPGMGILTVEGRVRNHNQLLGAVSQLTVKLPIATGPIENSPVPGLWLAKGETGNNTIKADVLLGDDCDQVNPDNIKVSGDHPETGQPFEANYTNLDFPDLPEIPDTAIPIGILGNKIGSQKATLSGEITLPQVDDVPTEKEINGKTVEVYEYKVDAINFKSGTHRLTITPGKKVALYLQGSIKVGANSDIIHGCTDADDNPIADCHPTNFTIYGYGDDTHSICMSGNNRVESFIFAPEYTAGAAGTGGGKGGIKGTAWVKEWSNNKSCGSNTNNATVVQTATWKDLDLNPKNLPPLLSRISDWQRNER